MNEWSTVGEFLIWTELEIETQSRMEDLSLILQLPLHIQTVEYLLRHIISKFKTALPWLLKELEGQLGVQNDPQVVSFWMSGLPSRIFDFDKVRDRNAIPYGGLIFDFTTASAYTCRKNTRASYI